MTFANGTIGEIIKALDMAAVEMLAISLPDAYVIDATQSLVRRWNCTRYDLIGHQLSQSADSLFHARYIDVDLTGLGTQTATRIEVTYRPRNSPARAIRFKPQLFRDGEKEYLLLIAQPAEGAGKSAAMDSGFELATKAAGYASWDYDFHRRAGSMDPRILRRLGLERRSEELSLPDLDGRVHPDDARHAIGARLRELAGATGVQSRYRLRAEDGAYVSLEVIAGIETDPLSGEPIRAFGLAREASTDLEEFPGKAGEAAPARSRDAAAKMEAVGRLASSLAQDFDSLFENLLANLELAGTSAGETDVGKRISLAVKAVRQGADLNRRLLELSRDGQKETETVDINAFLAGMLETLRRTVGERIAVSLSPASETWPCAVSPREVEAALLALAKRAREAMPDGGRLTLETGNAVLDEAYCEQHPGAAPGEYVAVAMSDTGRAPSDDGLSAELAVPGLETARSCVAGAFGQLAIHAEPGFGTTVRLFFPRAVEPSRKVAGAAETRRPVVLIVEDNDGVRDVAVAMVEEMDCVVLDAANGVDALDVLRRRNDINLLVSDVVMAGMSGPELVRQALKIRPGLKFLLASGYSGDAIDEAQDLPEFVDLIQKPFTREELTEKVRSAIAA